jgi:type I restriction enzyme S subunit
MIADIKPYPEYKESGLPWLGRVPGHWGIKRAKSIFLRIDQRSRTGKEELLTVSSSRGIVPRKTATVTMFKAESYTGYKLCWPGDLVINSLWAWGGGLGVSNHHGIISSAYGVYRVRPGAPMLPAFVHEVVRSSSFNWELQVRSKGVWISRLQLTDVSFLDAPFHIPPPSEQAAIVRFLDWANGRLEQAIRAKRKVITLLNEQKQAVIHRAVTRGLDPNVPLKPSGIPWLGEIPRHWEVRRIKYLLREVDKRSETGLEPLLSMRMHHGLVLFAEHFTRPPQASTLVGFKIVRPGQFVVNRMQAGNGVIYASTLTGLVSPDYAVFDPIGDANVEFLGELFRSRTVRVKFRAESKGLGTGTSGFLRLYNDRLGAIHVALPPRSEQCAILTRLGMDQAGVTTAISRLEREIALLREYRTRLVADVVTGKLDVRAAAEALPADDSIGPTEALEPDVDADSETDATEDEAAL